MVIRAAGRHDDRWERCAKALGPHAGGQPTADPTPPTQQHVGDSGLVLLGGSWVLITWVISRVTITITRIRGLITPLITTHEPPSRAREGARTGADKRVGRA